MNVWAFCAALLESHWHFGATWSEAVLTGMQSGPQCNLLAHLARQNQWPLHQRDFAMRPSSLLPAALSCHSCDKLPNPQRSAGPSVAGSVYPATCSRGSSTWYPHGIVHVPWPALNQLLLVQRWSNTSTPSSSYDGFEPRGHASVQFTLMIALSIHTSRHIARQCMLLRT